MSKKCVKFQKKICTMPPSTLQKKLSDYFFKFMYIDLKKNKIPCTRVHRFEEKTKFHVPRYMDLKKKQNSMSWI